MEEVRETLRIHSRYICDTLLPLVTDEGGSKLNDRDIGFLRTTLYEINAIPITLDLLRYSRIEKVLAFIAMDPRWPAEVMSKAQKILQKWENSLGPVDDLRGDLWGSRGRLEGLKKMKGGCGATADRAENTTSSWYIEKQYDLSKPYMAGHLGFAVGAWWIKSAAAVRDGIIGSTGKVVTADKDGAYAMILKKGEEIQIGGCGLSRYTTSGVDREALKLSKPMIGDRRGVIRVLRSSKLRSALAPAAGIRYDGLYRVVGYGVKLFENTVDGDVWTYSFTLQRECAQASIKEAICHPTADELEDYRDYLRAKAAGDIPTISGAFNPGSELSLGIRDGVERHMSHDSGYQSMKGFNLDGSQRKGSEGEGPSKIDKGKGRMEQPGESERRRGS